MDLITSFKICGSGLAAQRAKLDVVTSNLANVSTTRTPEGGPYRKKTIAFAAENVKGNFDSTMNGAVQSVKVDEVKEDPNSIKRVYDPGHPDADAQGFVSMPNVNLSTEMVDLVYTSKVYEANITAFNATKKMMQDTLQIQ